MKRFKYLSLVLFAVLLAGVIYACKKDGEDSAAKAEEQGKKAGLEMCACVASYEAPDPTTWTGTMEELQQAFQAYYGQLYNCLGAIVPYEEYARLWAEGDVQQNPDDPLLNVFIFHDKNFEKGFKEGVGSCYDTFNALWDLMQ